jgi:hypothetical protein
MAVRTGSAPTIVRSPPVLPRSRRADLETETASPYLRTTREAIRDRFAGAVSAYTHELPRLLDAERWATLLTRTAAFPHAFRNRALITLQTPAASRVGTASYWARRGRAVLRNAEPAVILQPVHADRAEDDLDLDQIRRRPVGFRHLPVFDIADTVGADLAPVVPRLHRVSGITRRWQAVGNELRSRGYRVEIAGTGAHDAVIGAGLVRISAALAPAPRWHALVGALGSIDLGHTTDRAHVDSRRRRDESNACAFLVAHAFAAQATAPRPSIGGWAWSDPVRSVADVGKASVDASRRIIRSLAPA